MNRFQSEENIFAYTGLVPKIYQSGNTEWKGHITKGNTFLKWMLIKCVSIHIRYSKDSPITAGIQPHKGTVWKEKGKIAAARHLLRAIYYMLKKIKILILI